MGVLKLVKTLSVLSTIMIVMTKHRQWLDVGRQQLKDKMHPRRGRVVVMGK